MVGIVALTAALAWLKIPDRPADEPQAAPQSWPADPAVVGPFVEFLKDPSALTPVQGAKAEHNDDSTSEFHRGIALGLYSSQLGYDYGPLIEEIADHHANWISFVFNMYQKNRTTTAMAPLTSEEDQEAVLVRSARQARERGLSVMLFPLTLLQEAGEREWRGNIEPESVDAWFENYSEQIVRLARLAEREGIEAFCIGSEFSSLERHAEHWKRLIDRVREVYSGPVLYSANWDHYQEVPFWERLDAIGLTGYYELTCSNDATLTELTDAWTSIRDDILGWREERGLTRPILFTEIGYTSQDGAAVYPWDYTLDNPSDPAEQATAYEAFMRAWHGREGFAGAYFYNWFGGAGVEDTGYSPRGKPAGQLLKTWYGFLAEQEGEAVM